MGELAELGAATRMGVRAEAGLTVKKTRFRDTGYVEGSFQTALVKEHRASKPSRPGYPCRLLAWGHLMSRRAQVSQAYMGPVT